MISTPLDNQISLSSLGLDLQTLSTQYRSSIQALDFGSYVRDQINAALLAQSSTSTYDSIVKPNLIQAQTLGLLPNTLAFNVEVVTAESAALPPSLRSVARLRLFNNTEGTGDAGLDITLPVHELFNQRATISYIPAELEDHRAILLAGGLDYAPIYLFRLRPELRLDGYQHSLGLTPLTGGTNVKFRLDIQTPSTTQSIEQTFLVGTYHAIGIGQAGTARSAKRSARDSEYDAARLLDGIVQRYESQWGMSAANLAQLSRATLAYPAPSVTIVSNAMSVFSVNATPYTLEWDGVTIDAAAHATEVITASATSTRQLQSAIGLLGSSLEHRVFESQFGVDAVSAEKLIASARAQNIPVITLASPNAPEVTTLPTTDAIKAEIKAWLQLGYGVEIPTQKVVHGAWSGLGWIVNDPVTGASGYYLSGGIAGGATTENPWTNQFLADALAGAHTDAPNKDPSAGVKIEMLNLADLGTVGQTQTISARVLDRDGRPVQGATVNFFVTNGGGSVNPASASTNALGVATTSLILGESTALNPIYIRRNSADKYTTRVGHNIIEAIATSATGPLKLDSPAHVYALPDAPATLKTQQVTDGILPGVATAGSTFSVTVVDKFDNPIPNVQVSGTGLQPTANCDPAVQPTPATVDGPYESDAFGVVFLAITPGPTNNTISPVLVTAGSLSTTVKVIAEQGCAAPPNPVFTATVYFDSEGRIAAATGLRKRFEKPFRLSAMQQRASVGFNSAGDCVYKGTRSFEPISNANVALNVSAGGSSLGVSPVGPGEWEAYVLTGPGPALNELTWTISGSYTADYYDSNNCQHLVGEAYFRTKYIAIGDVYGVRTSITNINSLNTAPDVDPSRLYLSDAGLNEYPIQIGFKLEPDDYVAPSVQMFLFQNGQLIDVRPSTSRQKQGNVSIERGNRFNVADTYEAQAYINDSVTSEKAILPFKQGIVTNYDRVLRISRDVDITNDRFCEIGSALNFNLSQGARITLDVRPLSDDDTPVPTGSPIVLVNAQAFNAGINSIPLAPNALQPTKNGYLFTITAVSDKDGSTEQHQGKVISKLMLNDALPVGNILVSGVNVKSGRINLSGLGFGVAARGPQLAFRPSYSSGGSGVVGVLGANWSHNFDASLSTTPCGDVLVNAGDGGFVRFLPNNDGTLSPAKGYHGTLIPNSSDFSYDFYTKDGTRYHFYFIGGKRQWALQSIHDTNGNTINLTYDTGEEAPLLEVKNDYGQGLYFYYQSRTFMGTAAAVNVLQTVSGPDNMGLNFEYDDYGNLIKITRTDASDASETYAYSDYNAPLGVANLLLSKTNAIGQTTQFKYNSGPVLRKFGNGEIPSFESTVIGVTSADGSSIGFAYNGNPEAPATAVADALGKVTNYTFNKYGNPLTIAGPAGTTTMTWATNDVVMLSKTDANGIVTNYTYDINGNQTSEQVLGQGGATTAQTWLAQTTPPFIKNKRLSFTDRRGLTTTASYDARGNLTSEQMPDGSRMSYSVAGNGDRQSSTDANGNTTKMRYDNRGMLTSVIDALGGTTSMQYDARGRQTSVVDAQGNTSSTQYNTLDQPTQIKLAVGSSVAGQKTITWDALGNKLSETDEEGRTTSTTYDAMNRVVRKSLPIGAVAISYDAAGNKVSETNLRGDTTTYSYDGANRLTRRTEPATPPKVTVYAYDGVGNITTETDALGRSTSYTYNALNQRTSTRHPDGKTSLATYDGNGNKLSETDALGRVTTYEYDPLNRLLSQTIAGKSKRSTTYDSVGNPISRTDANGNTSKFTYDALNRVIAETDALGRVTNTEYDKIGNKLQVTNPLRQAQKWQYNARKWIDATQDGEGNLTQYTYDKVGNQLSEIWPNGNIVTHEYDALNRRTRSSDSLGQISSTVYDADGNITRQTDARGNSITMTWDAIGRQLSSSQPTAAGNAVTATSYDAAGNTIAVTAPNGNVTTTQYDSRNRPVKTSDNLGTISTTTYDAVGNPLSQTDGRGRTVTYQYNDFNLPIAASDSLGKISTTTYDLHGNKLSQTDANGHTTSYAYDALNRITSTTHAGIETQKTDYDEAGRVQFETDARGNKVGYEYDKRGLLIKTNRSLGAIDQLKRNSVGDVILATDPEGRTTSTQYDLRRRATHVTDGVGNTTQSRYDLAGNLIEIKAPSSATTSYSYDSANRLISIAQTLTSGPVQATNTYDTIGNLVSQTDLNGNTTTTTYDARNRRTQKTLPGGAQETTGYDNANGVTQHTDANGNRFTHTLDIRGQRTSTTVTPAAANTPGSIQQSTYTYDGNGNLLATAQTDTQGTRTETTTYDAFNRPIKITDAWGNTLTHGYDAQGNRITTTANTGSSAGGSITTTTYDALNRRTSQSGAGGISRITYDKSSLVTRILRPDGSTTTTSYDRAGRVETEASSTGAVASVGNTIQSTTHTYDVNSNRLSSTTTESLSAANRSASLSAKLPNGTSNTANHTRTRLESWTYDAQDRLTSHTTPERTTTWQLDAGGRRIAQTVVATAGATGPPASQPNALETSAAYPLGTQTYTYNNRDQLTNITGATSASYTYDANGNRLTQTTTTKTTRYHWNAQDQLVSVEQDSGSGAQTLANYRYNADNLRAEKHLSDAGLYNATQSSQGALSTPLASQRIQWDGLHARRSFELTGANNSNPNNSNPNNASQTLRSDTDAAVLPGNTAPWLFNRTSYANGQGSTSTTTQLHADANGNLIATVVSEAGAAKADSLLHYNAYGAIDTEASGNASTAISSNANNFGSYYADPETGLLYARARYYDPASGQFISRDPVEGQARLPITWGAYQYGRYNPYRYMDPNGQFEITNGNIVFGSTQIPISVAMGIPNAIAYFGGSEIAQALAPPEPTPEQLQRGREMVRINRGFKAATQSGDIPAMLRYEREFTQLTAQDPTRSMLQVPMSSAINQALAKANQPLDRRSIENATSAAFGVGVSGMSASTTPVALAQTQRVQKPNTAVIVVENERALETTVKVEPATVVKSARAQGSGVNPIVGDEPLQTAVTGRNGLHADNAPAAKGGLGPVLKGESGVAQSIAAAEARGETVLGREITMQTVGGRTRPDLLVRDAQGNLKFIESKCGSGACLNTNQAARYPELEQFGGIPRGKNAANAGLTPGQPIGPTRVQVDYWPR